MLKKEEMITLLKNDVVPALGCTEPVCVALCAYLKNPEKGLELLEDITPEILEQMKELCGMAAVSVKIKEQEQGL